jgi:hypothetical protein
VEVVVFINILNSWRKTCGCFHGTETYEDLVKAKYAKRA